jgi:riboflavin synthase
MFTGLIEDIGTVTAMTVSGKAGKLVVETSLPVSEIALGDSVAVNGICLTVVSRGSKTLEFDVSPETIERSGLQRLKPGGRVNLERALRLGDRLGGHIVSGHIDCVAEVVERRETSGNTVISFRVAAEQNRYLVAKGSVTIDGVSLTVNTVSASGFSVNIIPHTGAKTTITALRVGDHVNIETDLLAKYVERLLRRDGSDDPSGVSLEMLAKAGFL